jgi:integrase
VLTLVRWLKGQRLLAYEACVVPDNWKDELRDDWATISEARTDYRPSRPRHSLEEMRAIIAAAPAVDPRLALALAIGAEQRSGQVVRSRRCDLDLEAGVFKIPGRKTKRGALIVLTPGQLAAIREALTTGYLRELERAGGDYPLFPSGQMPGGRSGKPVAVERHRAAKPIGPRIMLRWFIEAEELAKVPHLKGRAFYGVRRAGVDESKKGGISREGLMAAGGWSDSQVPDMIYSEEEALYAAKEAATHRARIRGEA